MPSKLQEQLADRAVALRRNVAVEAERHWWVTKLKAVIASTGDMWADNQDSEEARILDALDALIEERTR